jgi:beta-N-acetylhexosaminidase
MGATACGRLIVGGFDGTSLPDTFARALSEGRRGGAILFKRNVEGGPVQVAALSRAIRAAGREPPFVGVDQEGGRVTRLSTPFLEVPSMRTVASWGDVPLAERIARTVGAELASLGFTVNFAPVLDVNTRDDNPVIGDRSFGSDPETCARFGAAWVRGLQSAGLLACGKHFPGHGDTSQDSHCDSPVLDSSRERLDRIELVPFRAAVAAGAACLMTAHVLYRAIDPTYPATLSHAACTTLREQLGFDGVLFSDDLEMRAIGAYWAIEETAVRAIAAGCDTLLLCSSDQDAQERALAALEREALASPAFRARCDQAQARVRNAHRRVVLRPLDEKAVERVFSADESREVASEIARRLAR